MASTKLQPTNRGANLGLLNTQQRAFVEQLLASEMFNPTLAAKAVGYKNPSQAANKLMQHRVVLNYIGKQLKQRSDRLQITSDNVLRELALIGFSNVKKLFDEEGSQIPIHLLPDEVSAMISSYEAEEFIDDNGNKTTTYKVKCYNKITALELIAKHLGLLNEKLNVSVGIDKSVTELIPYLIEQIQGRPSNVIDAKFIESKALE